MNFFEHQHRAKRNTLWLVMLFTICVTTIITAVYVVVVIVDGMVEERYVRDFEWRSLRWDLLAYTAMGTLLVIGFGCIFKIQALSEGGGGVALLMGGRVVNPNTDDPDERRLYNVVEEMSIASGVPVPQIFVLDKEIGINAFAAGFSSDDAAVVVTRGCLQLMNRDELQGVIAHEFSHILNGDMRLNVRMIGLIHGILAIGLIGSSVARSAWLGVSTGSRSRSRQGGGAVGLAFAMMVIGIALMVIGSIGVLCGRIIRSAVSRQREFLADASAVQFTRNPGGIGGALKKIGSYPRGSAVRIPEAEEISHMFFANGLSSWLAGRVFATHPPLTERILRIDPAFDGRFPEVPNLPPRPVGRAVPELSAHATPLPAAQEIDPARIVAQVGMLNAEHLAFGAALLESIPEPLRAAAHEPTGAAAIVCALLLDEDSERRREQLVPVAGVYGARAAQQVERLRVTLARLDPRLRLPLIDMTLPALRQLGPRRLDEFRQLVHRLIQADKRVTLFEFSMWIILERRLAAAADESVRKVTRHYAYNPLAPDCYLLLSALAHAGHTDHESARRAMEIGAKRLPQSSKHAPTLRLRSDGTLSAIKRALDRLSDSSPILKERFVDAAAHCVLADRVVTLQEAELLRAIVECLGVPIPPFLPTVAGQTSEHRQTAGVAT
jgi:Zn-dependent protease with chaperone function